MWNLLKTILGIGAAAVVSGVANPRPAFAPTLPPANQRRITRAQAKAVAETVNKKYFNGRLSQWVDDAAAIIFVESSGDYDADATADKNAVRVEPDGRTSYGLMQVLLPTAQELYSKGYRAFRATPQALMTHEGGVYFGMAYIDYLVKYFPKLIKTHQDVIRAYNGGQGWKLSNRGVTLTAQYYNKFTKQYQANSGVA